MPPATPGACSCIPHDNGETMTKFRDLGIGDTFDWIGPVTRFNSYFARCEKLSPRTYRNIGPGKQFVMRVGSLNAEVFHTEHDLVKPSKTERP